MKFVLGPRDQAIQRTAWLPLPGGESSESRERLLQVKLHAPAFANLAAEMVSKSSATSFVHVNVIEADKAYQEEQQHQAEQAKRANGRKT